MGAVGQNHACVSFHGRVTRSWPGRKNYTKSISRKSSQTLRS
ncbi:MAG: alpha/beta hydrolase, partial [Ectopseudomonas oleovorans]